MGADCCGGKKTPPAAEAGAAGPSCGNPPAADSGQRTDCCGPSKEMDQKPACCTPNNERCNEECLKSVAATLCAEGVGCHAAGYSGHGSGSGSGGLQDSACDAHMIMAFAQYQSFLDNVRCICRSMIERGYKSCCKPPGAGTESPDRIAVVAGPSNGDARKKSCCSVPAGPTVTGKAGCCPTSETQAQSRPRCSAGSTGKSKSSGCCGSKQVVGNGCGEVKNSCSSTMKPKESCAKPKSDNCCDTSPKAGAEGSCNDGCCGTR
ncbi:hypothetical protein F4808DRAFT_147784 [Astrocystis sublimbata]|nr:hypothetical protein F4808DRAFT_147784 [Astrocystis sublimbata]